MCKGKLIRFFCPEANKETSLCPTYNVAAGMLCEYRKIWRKSEFRCCGDHYGECTQCPALYKPGHITVVDAWGVPCSYCGARMRKEIEVMMETRSDSVDPMDEAVADASSVAEQTATEVDDDAYMPEHVDEDEDKDEDEDEDEDRDEDEDEDRDEDDMEPKHNLYMPEDDDEDACDFTMGDDDICDCPECTNERLNGRPNESTTYGGDDKAEWYCEVKIRLRRAAAGERNS